MSSASSTNINNHLYGYNSSQTSSLSNVSPTQVNVNNFVLNASNTLCSSNYRYPNYQDFQKHSTATNQHFSLSTNLPYSSKININLITNKSNQNFLINIIFFLRF
jgi:hypothetical protein